VAAALAVGGRAGLASKGPVDARCRLSAARLRELETVLDAGPAAWDWDKDQCWTLARIADLVRRRASQSNTPTVIEGIALHLIYRCFTKLTATRQRAHVPGIDARQHGLTSIVFVWYRRPMA
jgi:hypothetical protein